jgi:hypothetical protein
MKEFYLYTEKPIHKTIEEIFVDFEIQTISKEVIKKVNLINKNILLLINENVPSELYELLLKNNTVIFFLKKNNFNKKKYFNTKVFYEITNIDKFKHEVITFFGSKPFIYKDIKIWKEKIINSNDKKEVYLTPPEKEILILLFERKKIAKDFLLENVLNLRKDTKTKTLESHLTRIRKKLISINSEIEIILRENTVFLIT